MKHGISTFLAIFACFIVTFNTHAAATYSLPKGVTIVFDNSLLGDKPVAEKMFAWLGYAVNLAHYLVEKGKIDNAPSGRYVPEYLEEVFAREKQIQIWREAANRKSGGPSTYLYMEQMLSIEDSGFLREYVWFFHYRREWGVPDQSLRMYEFVKQFGRKLIGHAPETRAWVEFKPRDD